jgi:hypothetical protein
MVQCFKAVQEEAGMATDVEKKTNGAHYTIAAP